MVQIHPPLPFLLRKPFESKLRKIVEHTADAGIEVEADSLAEAFEEVGKAFTEIVTGGKLTESNNSHPIKISANNLDSLLVKFISDLTS